jgi:beta-lactamase class A
MASSGASYFYGKSRTEAEPETDLSIASCKNSKVRLSGFKYIHPLLFTETSCESSELMNVKSEVLGILNSYKSAGVIMEGSVYLRELDQGSWMAISENENYLPGSLMKVPELITFMKMREKEPGLLDKKVFYDKPRISSKQVHYTTKSIEPGNSYTVRELLTYMIEHSDNNATILLNEMMDLATFQKVFTDLGIPQPDLRARDIPINAVDFSKFMRAIYNASYLNINDSEFCAGLLANSDFANGMRGGVPANIPLAHKFGEAGDSNAAHFSESGIIYINKSPYLLTIMTKGRDLSKLPDVIRNLTQRVFEMLNA